MSEKDLSTGADLITPSNIGAFLDMAAVVMAGAFGKTTEKVRTSSTRYEALITFLPFKLLPEEVEVVNAFCHARPFDQAKKSDKKPPIPNDLFGLKMSLLFTEMLKLGAHVVASQVHSDLTRHKEVEKLNTQLTKRFEEIVSLL